MEPVLSKNPKDKMENLMNSEAEEIPLKQRRIIEKTAEDLKWYQTWFQDPKYDLIQKKGVKVLRKGIELP